MLHAYGACPHRNRDSAIAKKKCIPNLTEGLGVRALYRKS